PSLPPPEPPLVPALPDQTDTSAVPCAPAQPAGSSLPSYVRWLAQASSQLVSATPPNAATALGPSAAVHPPNPRSPPSSSPSQSRCASPACPRGRHNAMSPPARVPAPYCSTRSRFSR